MQITKGYTFGSTESVTANKLHTLVDSAVIASPLTIANIDAIIGGTTPAAGSFTAITGTGTATFNDASNARVMYLDNDGTGTGLHIQQDGISATNKNALRIYSNSIQVNSPLAFIEMDNASSDQAALKIKQNGTGYGIEISNNNTGAAININQAGILATTKHAILAYSNAAQTSEDAALVKVWQDSPSSSEPALEVVNNGTGAGIKADSIITTNIDGILGANTAAAVTGTLVTSTGGIVFPTSDPSVAGAWWDDAGTLTKSSG